MHLLFEDAVWGFYRTLITWISHMDLLNWNVDFSVGSEALCGFIPHWCLLWVYFISIHANQVGNIHINTHIIPKTSTFLATSQNFYNFPQWQPHFLTFYYLLSIWLFGLALESHASHWLLSDRKSEFKIYIARIIMVMHSIWNKVFKGAKLFVVSKLCCSFVCLLLIALEMEIWKKVFEITFTDFYKWKLTNMKPLFRAATDDYFNYQ